MSIASEITRLQNAKSSIVTTLTNKGVTVPSGTKLEGINTLINDEMVKPVGTVTTIPKIESQTVDVTNYANSTVNSIYEEVSTVAALEAKLSDDTNRGKMYKYTGTSSSGYYNGGLYVCEEIPTYNITTTLTNITAGASNPTTIAQGGTATLTFTADSGYNLPDTVTITGATYTWTKASGTVVLSNPTGAVSISISGVENPLANPLTFTANTAGSTVKLPYASSGALEFQYKLNDGDWNYQSSSTTVTLPNVGDKLYVKVFHDYGHSGSVGSFVMTGSLSASGNIMSLVDSTYQTLSMGNFTFGSLFSGCTALQNAPLLPATTLSSYAYSGMFYGCTAITTPPALPVETLTEGCYSRMFLGCTGLTSAPTLPATTLADNCYMTMFLNCTSLTTPPALPATTLASRCYYDMFDGCTALTTAPSLPATTVYSQSYCYMFKNCTSLVTPPALPATTLGDMCYCDMFYGCTSLYVSDSAVSGTAEQVWRIPTTGTCGTATYPAEGMFTSCLGTRSTNSPAISGSSCTYYTQNTPV